MTAFVPLEYYNIENFDSENVNQVENNDPTQNKEEINTISNLFQEYKNFLLETSEKIFNGKINEIFENKENNFSNIFFICLTIGIIIIFFLCLAVFVKLIKKLKKR